jgi:drug/metabolite transporter (DMT)-like permease
MAVTVPLGVVCFLPIALIVGELARVAQFPTKAAAWMAGVGVLHFVVGRYCNFKANQVAGVNLTAPVVQLQVVVTMVLAVVILHEPCTVLQAAGGVIMVGASVLTQRQPARAPTPPIKAADGKPTTPIFRPRYVMGYIFASLAALCYGTSPIMARFALEHTGPSTGIMGGLVAYIAATLVVAAFVLFSAPLRRNAMSLKRENARWFAYSGVLVAAAQGFFFCGVAVAPVLLVMPLLQLSLGFRILFSTWLSPNHEVFGGVVLTGAVISIFGALLVSIDTGLIVHTLHVPDAFARLLSWRV